MFFKFLQKQFEPRDYLPLPVKDSYVAVLDDLNNVLFHVQSTGLGIKLSSVEKMSALHAKSLQYKAKTFVEGERVVVNESSGFHVGAKGTVKFVEPSGQIIWVIRDGATTPVYFRNTELDKAPRPKSTDTTGPR
jgi:hypothetical protein